MFFGTKIKSVTFLITFIFSIAPYITRANSQNDSAQDVRLQELVDEAIGFSTENVLLDTAYQATVQDLNIVDNQDNKEQSVAALLAKGCRSTLCKKMLNRLLQKRPNKAQMYAFQGQLKKMLDDEDYAQTIEAIVKDLPEIEKKLVLEKSTYNKVSKFTEVFNGITSNFITELALPVVTSFLSLKIGDAVTKNLTGEAGTHSLVNLKYVLVPTLPAEVALIARELVPLIPILNKMTRFLPKAQYPEYSARKVFAQPYKKLFAAVDDMETLLERNQELSQIVNKIDEFIKTENADEQEAIDYLEEILSSDACEPSVVNFLTSFSGKDRSAQNIIKGLNKKLGLYAVKIACLDMLLALKKFIENNRVHNGLSVCFAEFEGAQGITLKDFWNPFVDPTKVVTNDVILAENNPQVMLLTGPNTGGKSTLLKGVILNALLATHFGIATAQSARMPYFDALLSSINIKDDTANGISLFQNELNRAKMIQETVQEIASKNSEDQPRVLIIFDELFKGTREQDAEFIARKYLKSLLKKCSQCPIIFATHFDSVSLLAQDDPKNFMAQHIKIGQESDGSLIFYYKLAPGVNTINVAKILAKKNLGIN